MNANTKPKTNRRLTQIYADRLSRFPVVDLLHQICVDLCSSAVRLSSMQFVSIRGCFGVFVLTPGSEDVSAHVPPREHPRGKRAGAGIFSGARNETAPGQG